MRHKESGTVESVDEVQSGVGKTGREWRKREVIVNIAAPGSQWPNPVKITFWNDKEPRAALLNAGDEVTVEFLIRGSEFNGRHKVELNGYDVTVTRKAEVPDEPETDSEETDGASAAESDPDDLPF